ncbi:MAG TPA: hypothetical protein VFE50_23160 [Cyclobacteriaceae bacterium]|nr:hypothetical protein [Cyclobacteriaceae bacterium]
MKTGSFVLMLLVMVPIAVGLPSSPPRAETPIAFEQPNDYFVLETLTIYNPVENQCDADPLITANNSRIDLDKLSRNEIRWMALSRNLLKRWNGEFNYGDTVILQSGDPDIDGLWVVNDNMNKRFKDRGDLLFHRDSRTTGIWKNVKITRQNGKIAGT